jgi:pyruvate kinase
MQQDTDSLIAEAISAAKSAKFVKSGDMVVVTAGVPVGVAGNTSLIKVERVK